MKTFIIRYQLAGRVLDLENQVRAKTIAHAAQRLGITLNQIIDYKECQ